jgi:hypothetical protein
VQGSLDWLTRDSVRIFDCGACRRFTWSRGEISNLEAQRGSTRWTNFRHGVLIGAAAGAAIGTVGYFQPCHGDGCDFKAYAIPAGMSLGAILGGIASFLVPPVHWEAVGA